MKLRKSIYLFIAMAMAMSMCLFGCGSSGEEAAAPTETPADQAVIGVSWMDDTSDGDRADYSEDYAAFFDAIETCGGTPVALPCFESAAEAAEAIAEVDAVILTGGEDVNPTLYNEEPSEKLEDVNDARDTSDMALLDAALEKDMPVLAVCRGMQVLNVHQGGTLYQDVPSELPEVGDAHRDPTFEDFTYHNITMEEDSIMADMLGETSHEVNSWHHQAVKEIGEGLVVTAKADDGIIEGCEMPDKTYVVGMQVHPEWMVVEGYDEMQAVFNHFFDAAKAYAGK